VDWVVYQLAVLASQRLLHYLRAAWCTIRIARRESASEGRLPCGQPFSRIGLKCFISQLAHGDYIIYITIHVDFETLFLTLRGRKGTRFGSHQSGGTASNSII
jgi:hypothetical protein